MSASAGPGANSPPVLRPSMTASSGLMSTVRPDLRAAAPVRRGGQSSNTQSQFPFDVPVINWKSQFQDAAKMEQVRLQTVICHSGWLFKRAQVTLDSKRWFVLENNRLYSYMRQDYLTKADGPSDEYTMFPPSIRAVIDLDYCQIKVITKQKMLLEIECKERACWSKKGSLGLGNILGDLGTGLSHSTKTFTFYAEDDTSFQSWVDALARVEAYKKLKCQVPVRFQPPPEPLTFWDLPRESLLRIFCRMPDDKPEFKFFEKKWQALKEEDVMFYRRVVLLLNGSHQRAMDRHKQVALQEWEVNNSWKEVFEHITLNKLTSEPVIEVEYPKLELKLGADSKLAIKVKERMEIFADYKALPRILMRSLKELQELKIEQIMAEKILSENHSPLDAELDIEIWFLQVDPFVAKFQATQASALKDQKSRSRSAHHAPSPVVVETEEDVQFATQHLLRAVDIADKLLAHLGSRLMLEDGPVCEKGIIRRLYDQVMILIPAHKDVDIRNKDLAALEKEVVDIDNTETRSSVQPIDELDDNGNPIQLARKASKDPAHAPELFSDWEGGAAAMEPLSFVTFFSKIHGLIKVLLKNETDLQSYFGRICENLLKKDKLSDDAKGFRASTMKKEVEVQHLPVNGHVQTVAFRSLKSKSGEAARTDAIVQKISSFITVGSFSAHSLKFKQCRGYDGELLKLAKLVQSFDANLAEIFDTSGHWLKAVQGDETSITELDKKPLDELENSVSMSHGVVTGSQQKLQKQYDQLVSRIWKIFIPGPKSDISIPSIAKSRSDGVIRRSMSISQALSAFAEVIMSQIKTFYHGSCPDFWHILDLVGAFTLTVSCLVSVFHDEMGMLDDTYNACRWVIDRRLMIRLALMPVNLSSEQESDFFWTLCEDSDTGPKSSRSDQETATAYNILFRNFPCKRKKDNPSSICLCQVCNSHPLPIWDEKRSDEEFPAYFHSYRSKAAPSDFMQPVLVIYVRKKYWDKIPSFMKDQVSGSDLQQPTHLRYDYPLFPIFNNVGINENQRRAASMNPTNFLMQNRVNADAGAVFANIIDAVEINFRALSPNPVMRPRPALSVEGLDPVSPPLLSSPSFRPVSLRFSECAVKEQPVLIFKKLRPPAGPISSVHVEEPPPTLSPHDEDKLLSTRWPSEFSDTILGKVDGQELLTKLRQQIVDACRKCREACLSTRKVTKEMAKRMQQHAPTEERVSFSEDAQQFGENSSSISGTTSTRDASKDLQFNLQEPPIEQLEEIGDTSRSQLASGRIVMCKSAKDRTSMYVTYDQCRFLMEEHDPCNANDTRKHFMELVQRMRTDGTRIHNVRKNVHTSTLSQMVTAATGMPSTKFKDFFSLQITNRQRRAWRGVCSREFTVLLIGFLELLLVMFCL